MPQMVDQAKGEFTFQKTVGILGGGQLGRMIAQAASPLGIRVVIIDRATTSPALDVAQGHIQAEVLMGQGGVSKSAIDDIVSQCNVVTIEIEHVDTEILFAVGDGQGVDVFPSASTVAQIQDKLCQKDVFHKKGIPLAPYMEITCSSGDMSLVDLILKTPSRNTNTLLSFPCLLKARKQAYDGRGNWLIKSSKDLVSFFAKQSASVDPANWYIEHRVAFVKELAVMVAISKTGETKAYPVVETVHTENHICHVVMAPAQIDTDIANRAQALGVEAAKSFGSPGIFGVEMFLLANGDILVNEIAPRPHNSGHYTMDACYTSQFEQHLRAILGLPLGDTRMKVGASIMVNILGVSDSVDDTFAPCHRALTYPANANVHWYGKSGCRTGRKMGHVNVTGDNMGQVLDIAQSIYGTDIPYKLPASMSGMQGKAPPMIGIIMGSDSDLPVMKDAANVLENLGISYELTIVSAHRTPDRMAKYAKTAASRGLKAIIAGAGGAAHLPGMVAAQTVLPVIGVPIALRHLQGQDSLFSIVQMPRGIPVAAVAISNATNAALLASQICGAFQPKLGAKIEAYRQRMTDEVDQKIEKLERVGWKEYLETK